MAAKKPNSPAAAERSAQHATFVIERGYDTRALLDNLDAAFKRAS
jgi:hypothetical protein